MTNQHNFRKRRLKCCKWQVKVVFAPWTTVYTHFDQTKSSRRLIRVRNTNLPIIQFSVDTANIKWRRRRKIPSRIFRANVFRNAPFFTCLFISLPLREISFQFLFVDDFPHELSHHITSFSCAIWEKLNLLFRHFFLCCCCYCCRITREEMCIM